MEIVVAVAGLTDIAARTGSKLWSLSGAWRDAPDDLHRLRDDMVRTQQFFGEIKEGAFALCMESLGSRSISMAEEKEPPDGQTELQSLLGDGADILQRLEGIVDRLLSIGGGGNGGRDMPRDLGKRGRLYWMGVVRKEVTTLRRELREVRSSICRLLIAQNVYVPPPF